MGGSKKKQHKEQVKSNGLKFKKMTTLNVLMIFVHIVTWPTNNDTFLPIYEILVLVKVVQIFIKHNMHSYKIGQHLSLNQNIWQDCVHMQALLSHGCCLM